jgi:hypothetical protein
VTLSSATLAPAPSIGGASLAAREDHPRAGSIRLRGFAHGLVVALVIGSSVPALAAPDLARECYATSKSEPSAPAGKDAAAPVNSVDTVVADMRRMNDLPLVGAPPGPGWSTGPGHVTMGNRARGSATPSYWQPTNRAWKSDEWWRVLLPWIVIFDGEGNAATNTRIELRELKAYYKSRATGQWKLIVRGPVEGENYPKSLTGTQTIAADLRKKDATMGVTIKPVSGRHAFHGWCCGPSLIDPPDIAAVHVTTQARLVVDDPSRADDRSQARYLVQVGADYYPTATTKISEFAPTGYNPGVGLSRFKLVKSEWQAISFTTINVGVEDPRGGAISEAELRAAPPPLE